MGPFLPGIFFPAFLKSKAVFGQGLSISHTLFRHQGPDHLKNIHELFRCVTFNLSGLSKVRVEIEFTETGIDYHTGKITIFSVMSGLVHGTPRYSNTIPDLITQVKGWWTVQSPVDTEL